MQTTPVPYVNPSVVTFYLDESKHAQNFEILNPFTQDFLFKVDNAHPDRYRVSLSQGVVCSKQKIYIELSCTSNFTTSDDFIQVRFFKCSRPRHGQKSRAQQYIGYRVVRLRIFHNASERERTPSDHGPSKSHVSYRSEHPVSGSTNFSSVSSDLSERGSSTGTQTQVVADIIVTILLLTAGFVFKSISEEWFSVNVFDEVRPQTLAIVFFTLACVMIIKLLTVR